MIVKQHIQMLRGKQAAVGKENEAGKNDDNDHVISDSDESEVPGMLQY